MFSFISLSAVQIISYISIQGFFFTNSFFPQLCPFSFLKCVCCLSCQQLQRVWTVWLKRCEHSEELKLHSVSKKARVHYRWNVVWTDMLHFPLRHTQNVTLLSNASACSVNWNTVKPLLSGPPIKRSPSIKRTLSRVPKRTSDISLHNEPLFSGHQSIKQTRTLK